MLLRKKLVLHFNLYLNKFIATKFVVYYIKITQIDKLYRNLKLKKNCFSQVIAIGQNSMYKSSQLSVAQ